MHEDLARTGQGMVLGVTYQDSTQDSRDFVREFGITFPSVRDVGVELAGRFRHTWPA